MLIAVDTNCVVGQAISPTGAPAEILQRWRAEELDLAVSETILAEYERALGYERVSRRHGKVDKGIRILSPAAFLAFLAATEEAAEGE